MSANEEIGGFIYRCYKAMEENEPEKARKLLLTRHITVPLEPCDYCNGNAKKIFINPVCDIEITRSGVLTVLNKDYVTGSQINYCPMCGRKF